MSFRKSPIARASALISIGIHLIAVSAACSMESGGGAAPGAGREPPPTGYSDEGIYVSTAGDDGTGDGTPERPYRHIQYVLDEVAEPGDSIILRGGVYDERVRVRNPRISIRSKNDEWAIVRQPIDVDGQNSVFFMDVDSDGSALQRLEIVGGYYYAIQLQTERDDGLDGCGATDILIENCVIHGTGRDCVKVTPGCDRATIRACEIYDSGLRDDSNADGIDNVNADYMTVVDCHIHDTATNGLYFKGGAIGCVAERLLVEDCGSMGILLGFDTSPDYFDLSVNPEWYENRSGVVRNCIVRNTRYAGIGMYAALNPRVVNNTIIDAAREGQAGIFFGITYQDWVEEAGRPSTVNPFIRNNVVIQSGGAAVEIRYSDDLDGLSALAGMPDMDRNYYFRRSGAAVFEDGRPGSEFSGGLSGWKTHVGGESGSREVDPRVDDAGRLQAGSPCLGEAEPLADVTVDIDGESRGAEPDIGADER